MRVSTKAELLARMAQGPLPLKEWPHWTPSKDTLRVRIHYLRQEGYSIDTIGGHKNAAYRLNHNACPTCGQVMA